MNVLRFLPTSRLDASFFDRSAPLVARELLGQRLVRMLDGERLAGLILETEAYQGEQDLACHARSGLTPRTRVMFGLPGRTYVYFTYGMHWMLNLVTGPGNIPSAVLLRGLIVIEGHSIISARRKHRPAAEWTNGPAKICQAFAIDSRLNDHNLDSQDSELWVEPMSSIPDEQVSMTPRIGIDHVPEPWRSIPWRFLISPRT